MRFKRISFYAYVGDPVERENAITSLIDGSLYSVMAGLTTPFWGAFAVRLGASDYMLGVLSSLPALVVLLSQIPSAVLTDLYPNRLKPTLVYALIHRSFYLFFAILALWPLDPKIKVWTFILAFSLMNFPATTSGIAWTALMGEMFNPKIRSRIFGDRNMVCTLVSLLATAASGPFLDSIAWPYNYSLLYLVSYAFVLGSYIYLKRLRETPLDAEKRASSPPGMAGIRNAFSDKAFLGFILAVCAIHVGLHLPAALWTILWVRIMALSNTWLGLFSTASGAASFLSYRKWGEWCQKKGNVKILLVTGAAHILFPLIYAYFRSAYVYLLLNALAGFFGAGFSLSIFNALLDISPDASRPSYIALHNTFMGISGFVWPLLGVYLYQRVSMNVALDISFILRILGVAVALKLSGVRTLF